MIDRVRESRNPKKVIRVALMESYGEIGRVPVNLCKIEFTHRYRRASFLEARFFLCYNRVNIIVGWVPAKRGKEEDCMIRILIVEDDENISKMLAATLSIGDYEYDRLSLIHI